MEQLTREDILYDERAERIRQIRLKRQRKKRQRRRMRNLSLILILAAIILYFASDLSKVRSLSVKGNYYYTAEEIYDIANVSYETRYILKPAFMMEKALKSDELIEDAEVHKGWDGVVRIEIKEKMIVGYLIKDDQYYLLLSSGEQIAIDEKQKPSLVKLPLLNGFDDAQLEKLAEAFDAAKESVSADIFSRISEIVPYETSFNENMMKVIMSDGNILYGSYESASVMQIYENVLSKLKGNDVCLYMDDENKAMTKMACSEFTAASKEEAKESKKSDSEESEKKSQAKESSDSEKSEETDSAEKETKDTQDTDTEKDAENAG